MAKRSSDTRSIQVLSHGGQRTTNTCDPIFVGHRQIYFKQKLKSCPQTLNILYLRNRKISYTLMRDWKHGDLVNFRKTSDILQNGRWPSRTTRLLYYGYQNGWNKKYLRPKKFL